MNLKNSRVLLLHQTDQTLALTLTKFLTDSIGKEATVVFLTVITHAILCFDEHSHVHSTWFLGHLMYLTVFLSALFLIKHDST